MNHEGVLFCQHYGQYNTQRRVQDSMYYNPSLKLAHGRPLVCLYPNEFLFTKTYQISQHITQIIESILGIFVILKHFSW